MKEKIKQLITKALGWLQATRVYQFSQKWGIQMVNLSILILAVTCIPGDSIRGVIVGLWVFLLLVYYIMWKLFKGEDLFKKDEEG